jgi:hypothetical protein
MNNRNHESGKPDARRKILLGLSGGLVGATQLPARWVKPVVDSVLLPAHAAATVVPPAPGPDPVPPPPPVAPPPHFRNNNIQLVRQQQNASQSSSSVIRGILSTLVPNAHAGKSPNPSGDIGMGLLDNLLTYNIEFLVELFGYQFYFIANGMIDGGNASLFDQYCGAEPGYISITNLTDTQVSFELLIFLPEFGAYIASGTLPLGTGFPADPGTCTFT